MASFTDNLSVMQRLQRVHTWLMKSKTWVWIAPVVMTGKVTVSDEERSPPGTGMDQKMTAYTDGYNVVYGRKFCEGLNDAELTGLVLHENLHKGLRHLRVWRHLGEINPMAAGLAMDFVINQMIVDAEAEQSMPVKLPPGGALDAQFRGWDTQRVFDFLMANAKKLAGGADGKGGSGFDGHDWNGSQAMSELEEQQVAQAIDRALRQGQALSKKLNGNMPREVGELLEPAVDWRTALRDYVTQRLKGGDYGTYARPNRRYLQAGVYMPSKYQETPGRIGFFVDTSGSIGDEMISDALSEVVGCCEIVMPEAVDVAYWDTAVCRFESYSREQLSTLRHETKPAGGGGTAPSCVVNYVQARGLKYDVAIFLSDGYVGGDWAEGIGCPSLWIISPGGACPSHLPHIQLPER